MQKLSIGGPLVVHAHKIYTLKVFALFCELKEDSEFYCAIEVVQGVHFLAEHYNFNWVKQWCKGKYAVEVVEGGSRYICECGLFEHFGLPCSHILRVSV